MKFFPSRTTFLQIGSNLKIQWYAVLILTGAFVAYYFSKKNLKKYRNIDVNDFFDDAFIWLLWGGVIGARLWFCLFYNLDYYLANPINIIKVWDGGVAFHGAFAGGLLAAIILCKKRNVSFIKFCDAVVPTVLFAQAMGRWGNFINQECHGDVVPATYFDGILRFIKNGMCIKGVYYEPLFFYESSLCLLGFILINFILRKTQSKRGELTGAYLIWYGIVRFFIEGRRTDSLMIGSFRTAQVTSIIYVIIGIALYFGLHDYLNRNKKPTILFDFDGTLQDSAPSIINSFRDCFEKYDKVENFTPDKQMEVLGPPIKEMFEKYFPNEDSEEVCKFYRERNRESLHNGGTKAIEHAVEVTKALKKEGYHIGILTTRMYDSTVECLEICGFDKDVFDDIIGLDQVKKTKPDPEGIFTFVNKHKFNSNDVIVVGDSEADVKAGQNYGAYTIAYLVHEGKKPSIEALKPNRVITDLNEILDIVKEKHYFTYNEK